MITLKRKINIPVFVSHQGCPNDCVFCNQRKITGVTAEPDFNDVRELIGSYLKTAPREAEIEISFFGGSFTGIPLERRDMYLSAAKLFLGDERVTGIRISTRPDYIDDGILEHLLRNHVTVIELGAQSMIDSVLELNRRGHSAKDTDRAAGRIKEYGFKLGLQMMTGMYGSGVLEDIYTANRIIKLQPDFVRIYPAVVIEDTSLHDYYKEGKYKPQTLDEAVDLCRILLDMFDKADIKVIRIGLMAGEEINENKVIGPYHSSFKELVLSRGYYIRMREILSNANPRGKDITIYTDARKVSQIAGNKRRNIVELQKEFDLRSLRICEKEAAELEVEIGIGEA